MLQDESTVGETGLQDVGGTCAGFGKYTLTLEFRVLFTVWVFRVEGSWFWTASFEMRVSKIVSCI